MSISEERDLLRAISLILASAVMFGAMAVVIRLASKQLHPFEIAFFRNVFGFVFALPLLWRHGPGLLRTRRLPLYLGRCAIGMVSMMAGFWAIVNLPLAQAIAISTRRRCSSPSAQCWCSAKWSAPGAGRR